MEQTTEELKKYCEQCGTAASPQMRFCGACGLAMSGLALPGVQSALGVPQDTLVMAEPVTGGEPMDLGMAWVIYLAAMLLWLAGMAIPKVPLGSIVYLVAAFVMTRYVMRNLIEFHPLHDTVSNVFTAKIGMFLMWPVSMLILLFKLTVNRSL